MGFRDKLARFMYGRYGADALYHAMFLWEIICLFVAAVLNLIGAASGLWAFRIISWVLYAVSVSLMVLMLLRFFSRNFRARRLENDRYLRIKSKLQFWKRAPRKQKASFMDTDQHIFRQCPYCKATLRLPRQKGKHTVKCPRCAKSFTVRVKK